MEIFEALKFLDSNSFLKFGKGLGRFYLNFKLKGKHYYKAFWIDYNGSFDKLLIREKEHCYRNLNLNKVEKVIINFYNSVPLRDFKSVQVIDRVDLVEFCDDLKKRLCMNDFHQEFCVNIGALNLIFERQNPGTALRMKLRVRYSSIYRVFCLLKVLKNLETLDEDDVLDFLHNKDYVICSSLGEELKLVRVNGKDISEF